MLEQAGPRPRVRALSAKPTVSRSRPSSGVAVSSRNSRPNLKTEIMSDIYNGRQKSPSRKLSAKNLFYQGIPSEEAVRIKKAASIGISRSKEELYAENLQLKKEINRLGEQLRISKSRMESKSKAVINHKKMLEVEFEKELYWAGSKSHLVSGIKSQYQKIKKQHQQLGQKYKQMQAQLMESQLPEMKIYVEAVEMENKRLAQKLKKILQAQNLSLESYRNNYNQVSELLISELTEKQQELRDKLGQSKEAIKVNKGIVKQMELKISFLEKLIIEKDNKQHHLVMRLKKLEKTRESLQQANNQLKGNLVQKQMHFTELLDHIKSNYTAERQELISRHEYEQRRQRQKIEGLQEQNKQLENTVNKLRMSSSVVVNSSNKHNPSTFAANRSNFAQEGVRKQANQNSSRKQSGFFIEGGKNQQDNGYSSALSKSIKYEQVPEGDKPADQHLVRKADKKHSENAYKARKVQHSQVTEIGELLKYRLISQAITPQQVREYFSVPGSQAQEESEQQLLSHINMGEAEAVLRGLPFSLSQQQAHLLARYVIEDSNEQFVYCDSNNQNNRKVVKSIIKAVIGDYLVYGEAQLQEADQFMDKYETNLESALRTYYPTGRVLRAKFVDTMLGLGVEVPESVQEILLSRVVTRSRSMSELEYGHLFIKGAHK